MGDKKAIVKDLLQYASKEKAAFLPTFFKTGKGQYGEGDRFHGIVVPDQRKVAKEHYRTTNKETIIELLLSPFHEERLTGILILCNIFNEAKKQGEEKKWYDLYIKMAERINNWDLVDVSAHVIVGQYLEDKDRSILYKFAKDKSLWKNRISIVATWHFIRKNHDLKDILELSEIMLTHQHDLIHKATGWMLREGWKKEPLQIENFLNKNARLMPRTMLRYCIERMNLDKKRYYMLLK
jgi:3-methyladenine DNA glycosylase AlkD